MKQKIKHFFKNSDRIGKNSNLRRNISLIVMAMIIGIGLLRSSFPARPVRGYSAPRAMSPLATPGNNLANATPAQRAWGNTILAKDPGAQATLSGILFPGGTLNAARLQLLGSIRHRVSRFLLVWASSRRYNTIMSRQINWTD